MTEEPPLILLIEDDPSIRRFLDISLTAHGYRVRSARLGAEGIALCGETGPGLVILDLGLPDIDGQTVILRLREWSAVPIIVLSVRSDEREKVTALDNVPVTPMTSFSTWRTWRPGSSYGWPRSNGRP